MAITSATRGTFETHRWDPLAEAELTCIRTSVRSPLWSSPEHNLQDTEYHQLILSQYNIAHYVTALEHTGMTTLQPSLTTLGNNKIIGEPRNIRATASKVTLQ